jgi:ABC-2 type transport system ATP-binding protein
MKKCNLYSKNMNNILEIRNLRKEFNGFTLDLSSLDLPYGAIMGFVGQNGAGKTTTIRLLLNTLRKNSGEIRIFGLDNIKDELKTKQDLSVVFDDLSLIETWRVRDVERVIKNFYKFWDTRLYNKYLDKFHLTLNKKLKDLSKGMKMKIMIAVAMSHNARLLILDEPTSGLDPVARDELLDILKDYVADGKRSVFFSTHITSDLEKIADYITLIDRGKIFYTGTTDDLLRKYSIIRGEPSLLSQELKGSIIGLAENKSVFVGLLPIVKTSDLPEGITKGIPSIDEILVYISKEAYNNG